MEELLQEETAPAAAEGGAPALKNPYAAGSAGADAPNAPNASETPEAPEAPAPQKAARRNPYAAEGGAPAAAPAKTSRNTGWKVLAVIMCLVLLLNTGLSAAALALQAVNFFGSGMFDPEEWFHPLDPAREDDVTIGWEYRIESTLPISDAYISGDRAGLSDRELETLDMASAILDKIITPGMTDVEKEAAVYEWLTTKLESENGFLTVIPPDTDESDNPYGVLKYRSAVCVGYATTFRLFMQMLGIECMVIHDSSLSHSWNLVRLDGDWYHTDCYFDSPEGSYRHFNINDAVRAQEQDWNTDFFPAANGTKYNYAVYHCETLEDLYALPAWLRARLDGDERAFSCKFKGGVENEQAAMLMTEAACGAAMESGLYGDLYIDRYWTENDEGDYIFCVFAQREDAAPDYEVPEDTRDQIDQSVEEAFGVKPDWDNIWVDEGMTGGGELDFSEASDFFGEAESAIADAFNVMG